MSATITLAATSCSATTGRYQAGSSTCRGTSLVVTRPAPPTSLRSSSTERTAPDDRTPAADSCPRGAWGRLPGPSRFHHAWRARGAGGHRRAVCDFAGVEALRSTGLVATTRGAVAPRPTATRRLDL